MKKRILAILLALTLVCSLIPAQIFAEGKAKDEGSNLGFGVITLGNVDENSTEKQIVDALLKVVDAENDSFLFGKKDENCKTWWVYWEEEVECDCEKDCLCETGTKICAINLLDSTTWSNPETLEVVVGDGTTNEFVYNTKTVDATIRINGEALSEDNKTFGDYTLGKDDVLKFKYIGLGGEEDVTAAEVNEVGDYKVVLELKYACIFHSLKAHAHFSINPKSINDDEIVTVSPVVYFKGDLAEEGELYTPEITAKYLDEELELGKDYKVVYFKYNADGEKEWICPSDITLEDSESLVAVSRYAVLVKALDGSNYCDEYWADFVVAHPIVTYMDGDKEVDHMNVFYGDKAENLVITKDGYKLTWCSDPELKEEYDFDTPVTEDITLYAKWTAVTPSTGIQGANTTMIIAGSIVLLALAAVAIVLKKRASQK